jgi:hypothetical protein
MAFIEKYRRKAISAAPKIATIIANPFKPEQESSQDNAATPYPNRTDASIVKKTFNPTLIPSFGGVAGLSCARLAC